MPIITHSGTSGSDTVFGDLNNPNVFRGFGQLRDFVVGGNQDDTFHLTVSRAADFVDGGAGRDTVDYTGATQGLIVDLGAGSTTAWLSVVDMFGSDYYSEDYAWQPVTTLVNVENVVGTFFNDTIIGNWADNTIEGGYGADGINGGAGTDTASYAHSGAGVTINLAGLPGHGGLLGSAGFGSGGDAQGDVLVSIENLTGSAYGDVFYGNDANNTFDGGAGVDRVSYRYADEGVTVDLQNGTVTGGASVGTDTLVNIELVEGSRFNDTFEASSRSDTFVFGASIGHDTVDNFDARNSNDNHDLISFEGVFDSWEDLQDHIDRDGNDWTITIDEHNSLTLTDVRGTLDANDFYFG
jgi:hypothetical protein